MNLFYLDEHKACSNYSNAIQEGFIHYRVDAGKSYADESKKDCILFLLKGKIALRTGERKSMLNSGDMTFGEFYQFNLSSCIRQQNSLTAQFVSFSLSNLANIFYPPQFLQ